MTRGKFVGLSAIIMAILLSGCHSRRSIPDPEPVSQAPQTEEPAEDQAEPAAEQADSQAPEPEEPTLRERIVTTALTLKGVPYKRNGDDASGFDCSGFVWFVYGQFGIDLPRRSQDQYKMGRQILLEELLPGDLVFFAISGNSISHVGLFIRDNEFIHAPSSGGKVMISNLNDPYWKPRLMGISRHLDRR